MLKQFYCLRKIQILTPIQDFLPIITQIISFNYKL